ncbi:precorrin-2 C(20)-methyltransferase [Ferroplasma acidiphilum]|jgi:precorrin-2/cobalt-factor-2 C20-methyltransferase|uniref:precorrin-2 C(20)-methyltransferase n=1 Tax=Ferroplasma acidiphilum TaxID=74969 RepID=UPI0023F01987|nr:precorrin-2 C(20)-methyltransferase [Ferroplasma acidiphilum]MCL4349152.1 precorrin-2 C(20)-methyltransferase [Candidatus Thermoplasmatota archaeon]WMT53163.1 MAG: precorrin-2 C(20)-methyltransferase [Ferroplasma acidiphilum]
MSLFKVVGLGPGDPELITMKGYKAIMDADIVFYPKTSLNSAENILKSMGVNSNRMRELEFPIGSEKISALSREYAGMIMKASRDNLKSVYAVEGEPMLYSTFLDIMPYIDIEFDVIPGISSMNGISAAMKIILATKDEPLLVLPAVKDYSYMEEKIMSYGNVVIFKAIRAREIIKEIIKKNQLTNYYIMSYVSTEKEIIYNNIDDIKDYMTIVVIKRYT